MSSGGAAVAVGRDRLVDDSASAAPSFGRSVARLARSNRLAVAAALTLLAATWQRCSPPICRCSTPMS